MRGTGTSRWASRSATSTVFQKVCDEPPESMAELAWLEVLDGAPDTRADLLPGSSCTVTSRMGASRSSGAASVRGRDRCGSDSVGDAGFDDGPASHSPSDFAHRPSSSSASASRAVCISLTRFAYGRVVDGKFEINSFARCRVRGCEKSPG